MKHFSKIALMCICLLITAMFTTACGGGGKATPPSYPYFPINNQANNNQQENNNANNNENNNNNQEQEENNNQEEQGTSVEVTLTLIDSLNSENIAKADIFYSIEDNNKKTSADDKEILQAEPQTDDKTKFTVTATGTDDPANIKIKAIITYDSTGKYIDYFSSYNGIEGTNGNFDINFENSQDNEQGFGGDGTGTEEKPFIISQPRHFININKKDEQGKYLYLDKSFKQTADLDFTHLTGLKINKAEEDKDITIDVKNEKAPLYNDGKGIDPIGNYNLGTESQEELLNGIFQGIYDGDNHIIDGIVMANSEKVSIGLFSIIYNGTIQKLIIGENSIFFIDETNKHENTYIGTISGFSLGYEATTKIEQCENRAKILLSKVEFSSDYDYCFLNISGISIDPSGQVTIKKCKNTGSITIDSCQLKATTIPTFYIRNFYSEKASENTNEGHINITNNKSLDNNGELNIQNRSDKFTNTGNITVDNNTNLGNIHLYINALNSANTMNDSTNDGYITITNNKLDNNNNNNYLGALDFYADSFSNCVNNGNIVINNNSNYRIGLAKNILSENDATGCTNTGTVTVDGVEGEIYNNN